MAEALTTQTPDQIQPQPVAPEQLPYYPQPEYSAEQIAESFQTAQSTLLSMRADPQFDQYCFNNNVNPKYAQEVQPYWTCVTEYAGAAIARTREKQGDSLQLRAFELVSSAPEYFLAERELHRTEFKPQRQKLIACEFLNKLGDFAQDFPETKPSDVEREMLNTANQSFTSGYLLQSAERNIKTIIKGVKHETGFGQLLEAAGFRFHRGNLKNDLEGGDYLVALGKDRSRLTHVDVKSSVRSAQLYDGQRSPFSVKSNGKVIIYSQLTENDFGDSFYAYNDIVQQKAPKVRSILMKAKDKVQSRQEHRRNRRRR
jgi:hypothetical protein